MAEIENILNEEYLKKRVVIRDRMEKLQTKVKEVEEIVAGMDFFRVRLFSRCKKTIFASERVF